MGEEAQKGTIVISELKTKGFFTLRLALGKCLHYVIVVIIVDV